MFLTWDLSPSEKVWPFRGPSPGETCAFWSPELFLSSRFSKPCLLPSYRAFSFSPGRDMMPNARPGQAPFAPLHAALLRGLVRAGSGEIPQPAL
jgi:hypothetical protein